MSDRWEYMSLIWQQVARQLHESESEWQAEFFIRRGLGGSESETRRHYDYGMEEDPKTNLVDLLNEFGAEGWEVVSESSLMTAAGSLVNGFAEIGAPVEFRWLLKRRV